jgi:hypothetical protein
MDILESIAVVVTSIAAPNDVLKKIASDCVSLGHKFYMIGDTKSPEGFSLSGCDYYSVDRQLRLDLKTPALVPTRHYARKNIGYLRAIGEGADIIIETDDDNMPRAEFYQPLGRMVSCPSLEEVGWVNVYRYYSDLLIWPRGLPLDAVNNFFLPHSTGLGRRQSGR